MATPTPSPESEKRESPLSLRRLTDAFAVMMGKKPKENGDPAAPAARREVAIDTVSITEALLFVGQPDNAPLSAERLASTMRDVTPAEVAAAVGQLNARYDADGAPYTIAESAGGYRMVLREEFRRVREKFHGKVRQARLSPAAMEVLAVVAYRQGVTLADIDGLRREKSQSLVNQLVRRGLLRLERSPQAPKQGVYVTTERFLRLFGLTSLDQLPRAEEFDLPAQTLGATAPAGGQAA